MSCSEVTRSRRHRRRFRAAVLVVGTLVAAVATAPGSGDSAPPSHELVSLNPSTGAPLPTTDQEPSISSDGNIVAFSATSGVPGDVATVVGKVRDRAANTVTDVPAVDQGGTTGNTVPPVPPVGENRQEHTAVSGDGCHIAFWAGIQNDGLEYQLYSWDRCAPSAVPVAAIRSGTLPSFRGGATLTPLAQSDDGRFIAFAGTIDNGVAYDVGVADVQTGTQRQIAIPTPLLSMSTVDISADGGVVAFDGAADTEQVPTGVYVAAGGAPAQLVSLDTNGGPANGANTMPSLSGDGGLVAFVSNSSTLAGISSALLQLYVLDRASGRVTLVADNPGVPRAGNSYQPDLTSDGSQIGFVSLVRSLRNGEPGPFIAEVVVARPTGGSYAAALFDPISVDASGRPAGGLSVSPKLSRTGRFTAFSSDAGGALSGNAAFPAGTDVWLAERLPQLAATSPTAFGIVDVGGSSVALGVQVTNTSNVSVVVDPVAAPGAPFSVTADTCSGATLTPGGGCAVAVTFRPTAAGTATGRLVVTGEGTTTSSQLVGSGRAARRSLTIAPASTSFPDVVVGAQSAPALLTVTNAGSASTSIAGIGFTGAAAQFSVTSDGCTGSVLAVGATCAIRVSARPTAAGVQQAGLVVRGSNAEQVTGGLLVTGRVPAALTITPPALDFGTVLLGAQSAPGVATVTNAGGVPVTVASIAVEGEPDQFTVIADDCSGKLLAAAATCAVTVVATPTAFGGHTATLAATGSSGERATSTLRSNGSLAPTLVVNPGVVRPGDVTTAIGAGFPPNRAVELRFTSPDGGAPIIPVGVVTTDAAGSFRFDVFLLRNGLPVGPRQLIAVDQPEFSGVRAPLLIDQGTARPSGSLSSAILTGVSSIVGRNG